MTNLAIFFLGFIIGFPIGFAMGCTWPWLKWHFIELPELRNKYTPCIKCQKLK